MKVYVDELPIGAIEFGCDNCPYAEIQGINHYFINNEFVSYRDCVCKLDKNCGFKQGEKLCPIPFRLHQASEKGSNRKSLRSS